MGVLGQDRQDGPFPLREAPAIVFESRGTCAFELQDACNPASYSLSDGFYTNCAIHDPHLPGNGVA